MADSHPVDNEFLSRITTILDEHFSEENFGVSALAHEIGMSRSNLLRKVKNLTKISASQFINQYRLNQAMELLRDSSLTVSEVTYRVGFSSTSYFIKCFHDYYGYPPGEVGKKEDKDDTDSQTHQLAAIMFTDIEGYTALMQKDEKKAVEFRKRHREVFNSVTKKFHGRILQYYGDGTLSTFSSAIDAVRCGIEMQLAFQTEPQIPVRIGIHTGDIIVSKDDIIGDGVNVASRIESLATVGSVFVSEKVYDEIKNQSGIQCVSMGVFELKNVSKPMEVFAITNPGLVIPKGAHAEGKVKPEIDGRRDTDRTKRLPWIRWAVVTAAVLLVLYLAYTSDFLKTSKKFNAGSDLILIEKSIAVLPFRNESNDSTNVYLVNGLMESVLNDLQKIKDLRVVSRTSVEKYRNASKTIPEIAKELNVSYLVEGSGQKIGDQVQLNIQLIEANSDRHLWGEQYNRQAKDIFQLQAEVAKKIADEIQVIITPEIVERIDKPPTDDLVAYDFFLKGLDILNSGVRKDYPEAIGYFESAIELDPEFARAYSAISISYYYLDEFQAVKQYTDLINFNADKALFYDPELPQSQVAKALFYMNNQEYRLAETYFEKALEYNPNLDLVFIFMVDLYANYLPDTEKYLKYALKGLKIEVGTYDSITTSYMYLHICNAFIQTGFNLEAEKYVNKSLKFSPKNLYSEYVKAYILYAKNRDLNKTKDHLIQALEKDTTRIDILQEIAKVCYFMRDYEESWKYYKKYLEIKEALNMYIYPGEDIKIAYVLSQIGMTNESEKLLGEFKEYAENDQTIYKHLSLTAYYSYMGETDKALEHLKLFSKNDNYNYWIVIFTPVDPLLDNIKDLPEFGATFREIESKFWKNHREFRTSLEEEGLI